MARKTTTSKQSRKPRANAKTKPAAADKSAAGKSQPPAAAANTPADKPKPPADDTKPAAETKAPPKPKRPKHEPHAAGERFGITLKRNLALGNGNRQAGDKLATIVCEPGVEVIEVVNALRNPAAVGIK